MVGNQGASRVSMTAGFPAPPALARTRRTPPSRKRRPRQEMPGQSNAAWRYEPDSIITTRLTDLEPVI